MLSKALAELQTLVVSVSATLLPGGRQSMFCVLRARVLLEFGDWFVELRIDS